jgi:glycosyltransferase involved in cell wall biosynthesis
MGMSRTVTTIDVLVPIFNRPFETERAIKSVLSQTTHPTRLILVDDGSTDPAIQNILQEYSTEYPIISLITLNENVGIVGAQNVGIKSSSSEYIAFLDCDDWLAVNAIETVLNFLSKHPCEYVFTDRIEVTEELQKNQNRLVRYGGQFHRANLESHSEVLLDHMIASHLKVISRKSMEFVGLFEEGTSGVQDWDLALKISEKFELAYLPEALYFHSIHSNQDTSSNKVLNIKNTNEVRRKAQIRRFKTFSQTLPLAGPSVWKGLCETTPNFAAEISMSSWFFSKDAANFWKLLPLTTGNVVELMSSEVTEIFIVSAYPISPKILKTLWQQFKQRPQIGAFVLPTLLDFYRWNNSYFDYLYAPDPLVEIGLMGYLCEEVEIFSS